MKLEGKKALVTGGASGIGRATILQLAQKGCDVAIHYHTSKEAALELAHACTQMGSKTEVVQGDVSREEDCEQIVGSAQRALAGLDVLVNNAGWIEPVSHLDLEGLTRENWQHTLEVNLLGPFACARAASPFLREGRGEIVMVSSIAGAHAMGSSIPYCAAKAGLNSLTHTLARALAPEIRVNAVAPGYVSSPWHRRLRGEEGARQLQAACERAAPLGKVCTPDDVASAIVGIVAGTDLLTGQVLTLDGGRTL